MHGTLGCPVCGAANIALGSTACPNCGIAFASPVVTPSYAPVEQPPAASTALASAPTSTHAQPRTYADYEAPATETVHYASIWRRMGAAIIDSILLTIPFVLYYGPAEFFTTDDSNEGLSLIVPTTWGAVAEMVPWMLYVVLMLGSSWQATVGMRMLGLRVVTDEGHATLSYGKAFLRELATHLSMLILCIGYLMIAFTAKRQALHDMITGTVVLHDRR